MYVVACNAEAAPWFLGSFLILEIPRSHRHARSLCLSNPLSSNAGGAPFPPFKIEPAFPFRRFDIPLTFEKGNPERAFDRASASPLLSPLTRRRNPVPGLLGKLRFPPNTKHQTDAGFVPPRDRVTQAKGAPTINVDTGT
jgi:hypothetical protein